MCRTRINELSGTYYCLIACEIRMGALLYNLNFGSDLSLFEFLQVIVVSFNGFVAVRIGTDALFY
jgi:hypothetical protein